MIISLAVFLYLIYFKRVCLLNKLALYLRGRQAIINTYQIYHFTSAHNLDHSPWYFGSCSGELETLSEIGACLIFLIPFVWDWNSN